MVKFPTIKTFRHYIGQVVGKQYMAEFVIKFLRKRGQKGFTLPDSKDLDIVNMLPDPVSVREPTKLNRTYNLM